MNEPFPLARYKKGKIHLVNAVGNPDDGSLHGQYTVCGRVIKGDTGDAENDWTEVWPLPEELTRKQACHTCYRFLFLEDICWAPIVIDHTPEQKEAQKA